MGDTPKRYHHPRTLRSFARSFLFNMEDQDNELAVLPRRSRQSSDEFVLKERILLNKRIEEETQLVATVIDEPPEAPVLRDSNLTIGNQSNKPVTPVPHFTGRTIQLNIAGTTSLSAILARVCGGPLESVVLLDQHTLQPVEIEWACPTTCTDRIVQLQFDTHQSAVTFFEYASTLAFKINGQHPTASWLPSQDQSDEQSDCMDEPESARRVLVFKRPLSHKQRVVSKTQRPYPDAIQNYSAQFDIHEAVRDFSRFGRILDATPVISRKLCFGIQFADVTSAMMAKYSMAAGSESEISRKYSDWYVWYGKDPTDRPAQ